MTKLAISALEKQWANLEQLHSENIQFWAGADIQAGSWFLIISLFLKCVQQSPELIKKMSLFINCQALSNTSLILLYFAVQIKVDCKTGESSWTEKKRAEAVAKQKVEQLFFS